MRGAVKVTLLLVVIAMAFFLGRHRQAIRESNEGRARIAAENDLDVSPPPPHSTNTDRSRALVRLDPSRLDLGTVPWLETIHGTVMFTNGGPHEVTINEVGSACGCTAVDSEYYRGLVVAPGETIPIDFDFRTGSINTKKSATIHVTLTSGTTAAAEIEAAVVGSWSIDPDDIDFGDVVLDSGSMVSPSMTVVFRSTVDRLTGIDISAAGAPWLEYVSSAPEEGVWVLVFSVNPSRLPPGVNTALVTLRTTSEKKPTGFLSAQVRGRPLLNPSFEHVGLVGMEAALVRFMDAWGAPVRITAVQSRNKDIAATVVSESSVELRNLSGKRLPQIEMVTVHGEGGATCVLTVSAN